MKVRLIAIILVILAGIATFGIVVFGQAKKESEYSGYIALARQNAEKGVPYVAVKNYSKAFAVKAPDEELYKEYVEQCRILEPDAYYNALQKYVVLFPDSPTAYEGLCTYYYDNKSYIKIFPLALEARNRGVATEKVRDIYLECAYMYNNIRNACEEAGNYIGRYAKIKFNGGYGFIDANGLLLLPPDYDDATSFINGYASVCKDGEWYMINEGGYKVAVVTGKVDYLSFLNDGKVLARKEGKYGYMDSALNADNATFSFDDATNFKKQIAAAKKDGKWGIIKSDGTKVTEFEYEDVIRDEFNTCTGGGAIFLKKGGKYYLYDLEGKQLSQTGFDDACLFLSDSEYAAVKVGNKWGFIDKEGKMVIEPKYDEAKSFNIGLAPVMLDGKWGFINQSEKLCIENTFEGAGSFNSNGIATVFDGELWNYIKLLPYVAN